jgi:chemotaxis signal transduction protein
MRMKNQILKFLIGVVQLRELVILVIDTLG